VWWWWWEGRCVCRGKRLLCTRRFKAAVGRAASNARKRAKTWVAFLPASSCDMSACPLTSRLLDKLAIVRSRTSMFNHSALKFRIISVRLVQVQREFNLKPAKVTYICKARTAGQSQTPKDIRYSQGKQFPPEDHPSQCASRTDSPLQHHRLPHCRRIRRRLQPWLVEHQAEKPGYWCLCRLVRIREADQALVGWAAERPIQS